MKNNNSLIKIDISGKKLKLFIYIYFFLQFIFFFLKKGNNFDENANDAIHILFDNNSIQSLDLSKIINYLLLLFILFLFFKQR